jgi:hypothetical protein
MPQLIWLEEVVAVNYVNMRLVSANDARINLTLYPCNMIKHLCSKLEQRVRPQGLIFANKRQHAGTQIPALINVFANAVHSAEIDTKLAHFVAIAYDSGTHIASTEFEYSTPFSPSNPY